jgi:DNA-binding response OmpR family regulator
MVSIPERSSLGASGFSDELFAHCSTALAEIAALERLSTEPGALSLPVRVDALLVALGRPLTDSMAAFSRLRHAYPLVPLLVLAEGVDGNFVAELLKCGAEDFLLLPPSPEALARKVQRMLGEASGPVFDLPEFDAFRPREIDINQRHCFRVSVPTDFSVSSIFPGPVERALDVKDLSIETERAPGSLQPGGMQISAERAMARRLPFDQWHRRREIELTVQLPSGSPIKARGRLIPGLRHAGDGSIRFAVEYWLTRPAEKERFRRYWVEAQRRARRAHK